MITRIEDGPDQASGLLVAYTDGPEGKGVLVQAGTTRFVLDPADAEHMAGALELVAAIVAAGGPPPGAILLPIDASAAELSSAADRNSRVGRA